MLDEDTSSAAAARRFVRETLAGWDLDAHIDTAMLLISELVTNAVLHARCGPEVMLSASGGVLRVEVYDASPVLPARRHYGLHAGTGRGMVLVEEMAAEWGAEPSAGGKVVWFELRPGAGANGPFHLDAETLADIAGLDPLDGASPIRRPGADGGGRGPGGSAGGRGPRARGRPRALVRARSAG